MSFDELRQLATAATPGPWDTAIFGTNIVAEVGDDILRVAVVRGKRNRLYIAAVSPDVVLALLDEVERLKKTLHCCCYTEPCAVPETCGAHLADPPLCCNCHPSGCMCELAGTPFSDCDETCACMKDDE